MEFRPKLHIGISGYGTKADEGSYILDAKSMGNFLRGKENATYAFTSLKTDKEIDAAIMKYIFRMI